MPISQRRGVRFGGVKVSITGSVTGAVEVTSDHLGWLEAEAATAAPRHGSPVSAGRAGGVRLETEIGWTPSDPQAPGSEAVVQAVSGLMAVHSRGWDRPRPIGLDVLSVAAGLLAAQGALAAVLARARGRPIRRVRTSGLHAAVTFLTHHLANATCGNTSSFSSTFPAPGPPFATADGALVELEILTGHMWFDFWKRLGADPGELGKSWPPFAARYIAGGCTLPACLHEATRRCDLARVQAVAWDTGVAVCRVRSYGEVLAELCDGAPPRPPWTFSATGHGLARSSRPAGLSRPLEGFKVVEVTSRLQGPLAGQLLRQLGADVVKVEPPGGDPFRYNPPHTAGSQSASYLAYNRGKQVVEVDYKQPSGREAIAGLVREADVFLHNWPAGRAGKLGLDSGDLARVNPTLVYAHASGWGASETDGPATLAGDFLVQAHAACGDGIHPADFPAVPSRVTIVDVLGALVACEGILGGLCRRERTGCGCRVDTSLYAGALTLQGPVLRAIAAGREQRRRAGRPVWTTLERPLLTADGFLVVAVDDAHDRQRLAAVCGVAAGGTTADQAIVDRLRSRPAVEWERALAEAGVAASAVRTDVAGLPDDPRAAPCLESIDGSCWAPAAPWQFVA